MKKIICIILLISCVCLPLYTSPKEEYSNSSLEDNSNVEVVSLNYTTTTYDMSLRDYTSKNDFVNNLLKAFWELWDLITEEFENGSDAS